MSGGTYSRELGVLKPPVKLQFLFLSSGIVSSRRYLPGERGRWGVSPESSAQDQVEISKRLAGHGVHESCPFYSVGGPEVESVWIFTD